MKNCRIPTPRDKIYIYTSKILHHLKELSLDSRRIHKTALKLRAHSVYYATNYYNKMHA